MQKYLLTGLILLIGFSARSQDHRSKNKPADSLKRRIVVVEQEASFPGGISSFNRYISLNLRYPEQAYQNKVEGVVKVSFTIDSVGKPTKITVIQSVSPEIDAEAVRVITNSPRWKPPIQNSIPVSENFTIDVPFKIKPKD